jgi:predicted RND superfamily exporter protein
LDVVGKMKISTCIEKILGLIIRFRIPVILILILGLLFGVLQMPKMKIDNSLDIWFVKNDPVLINYRTFQEQFGNDEIISIVFSDKESILTQENKTLIENISEDIEKSEKVREVYSIVNSKENLFLSGDKKTTMLIVELESIDNIDEARNTILTDVREILDTHLNPLGRDYHLAGLGVVYDALNQISLRDSNLFISLSYILIFLVLSFFIRRIRYILVSFIIILYGVVLTMGIYYLSGNSINMVTMVLPTLVMIFGVADVIHIVNKYFHDAEDNPSLPKYSLIKKSIGSITIPCFLTSLTTAVGFASLTISKMQVIQDLGLFASIGIMIAFLLSITISTIMFSFFRVPKSKKRYSPKSLFLTGLARFILKRYKIVLAVSTVIFITFAVGIFRIRVDTFSIQFLRSHHPVRKDSDYIESNFGYYTPIEFTLHGNPEEFLDPQNLKKVKDFQKRIEEDSLVENTVSFIDFLPTLSLLDSSKKVREILPFISEEELSRFANPDFSVLRITGRVKMLSARGFKDIIDRTMEKKEEIFDHTIEVKPNGYLPLYVKMMEYIMNTQLSSFSIAFIIIFMIIALYAGSVRLGFFAILPNLFPLAITLGIMGWLNIRLDIATVTITAIAIGVVVDDTMHFLYKYKIERRNTTREKGLQNTIREVGWPIISTSVILILGFTVVTLAQVNSIRYFGILSAIVIFAALLGDLFILPSLILTTKRRRKRNGK